MYLRHLAKDLFIEAAYWTGSAQLIAPIYGGIGAVLCFHRVLRHKQESLAHQLTVTTAFLDQIIRYFRDKRFRFLSVDELPCVLGNRNRDPSPFLLLTFDDGYRDNMTNALPVLQKYNVPAIFYVPSGAPDCCLDPWWLRLEHAIFSFDELVLDLPNFPSHLITATFAQKVTAYAKLTHYVHSNIRVNRSAATQLLPERLASNESLNREYFLNWNELQEFSTHSLVTVGAHTASHVSLSGLDQAQAFEEIRLGRDRLASMLGTNVTHFAYPYGTPADCGAREVLLAGKAGFTTAVTLQAGNIFARHRDHLLCLPRFAVGGQPERMRRLIAALSGARAMLALSGPFVTT